MRRKPGLANSITVLRLLCAAALLFCEALSPAFYILYVIAGITDMVDGPVARKTDTVSELGAGLDSAADFVLLAVCLLKLLPVLALPAWLLIWIAVVALIRIVNLVSGLATRKRLVFLHTAMNRITGLLLFALPLALPILDLKIGAAAACAAATFAAVQEGHFIRTGKDKPAKGP